MARKSVVLAILIVLVVAGSVVVTDVATARSPGPDAGPTPDTSPAAVTPTASSPTTVDSCRVINRSGHYDLTTNLTDIGSSRLNARPGADACIVVNASDVVFDGNGHHLDSVDPGFFSVPVGIYVDGFVAQRDNVTIRNVTLSDWGAGVEAFTATGLRIDDVTAFTNPSITLAKNTYGVRLFNVSDTGVRDSLIHNTSTGIRIPTRSVSDSRDVRIENNEFRSNADGIRFSGGNATVANNSFEPVAQGIGFSATAGGRLHNNTIVGGTGHGISLSGENVTVTDNAVRDMRNGRYYGADNYGLDVVGGDHTLRNNSLRNNTQALQVGGAGHLLRNNTMVNNSENVHVDAFHLDSFAVGAGPFDLDTSNTVDGDPIYYRYNVSGETFTPADDPGYIALVNSSDVRVRGVTLANNTDGLYLWNVTNATVANTTLSRNAYGIDAKGGTNVTIRGSHLENNTLAGIKAREINPASGTASGVPENYTLRDNWIVDNGGLAARTSLGRDWHGTGVFFAGSNVSTAGTVVARNAHHGIDIQAQSASRSVRIVNNTGLNNGAIGIHLSGWLGTDGGEEVVSNIASGNGASGIVVSSGSGAPVLRNTVRNNSDAGIRIGTRFTRTPVRNNTAIDNGYGVRLSATDSDGDPIAVGGNVVIDNRLSGNDYGIYVGETSRNNTLRDNVVTGNGYGIYARKAGPNRVLANEVSANRNDGINIDGYRTDSSGVDGSYPIRDNTVVANGGAGIRVSGPENIAIVDNGHVRDNGETGIGVFSVDNATLINHTVTANGLGVSVFQSGNVTIRNLDSSRNAGDGIRIHGPRRVDLGTNLTANANGEDGIELRDIHDVVLEDITANGNNRTGFTIAAADTVDAIGAENVTLRNVTARRNGIGIYVETASEVVVAESTVAHSNASKDGVFVGPIESAYEVYGVGVVLTNTVTDSRIGDSTVTENDGAGILARTLVLNVTVDTNDVQRNGGAGIDLGGFDDRPLGVADAVVEDNRIANNGAEGLITTASNLTVRHNRIENHSSHGVALYDPSFNVTIDRNNVRSNTNANGTAGGVIVVGAGSVNVTDNLVVGNDIGVRIVDDGGFENVVRDNDILRNSVGIEFGRSAVPESVQYDEDCVTVTFSSGSGYNTITNNRIVGGETGLRALAEPFSYTRCDGVYKGIDTGSSVTAYDIHDNLVNASDPFVVNSTTGPIVGTFGNTFMGGVGGYNRLSVPVTNATNETNALGGSRLGGNAWLKPDGTGFSQTCSDSDNNGICDRPFVIEPFRMSEFKRCHDIDNDGDRDDDDDALCDNWETTNLVDRAPLTSAAVRTGLTRPADGPLLSLVRMGATHEHKDIFVEIDYMTASGHSHRPKADAIAGIRNAFAGAPVSNPDGTTGIRIHPQVDDRLPHQEHTRISPIIPVAPGVGSDGSYNKLKRGSLLKPCDGHLGTSAERSDDDCKTIIKKYRKKAFHYALFLHNQSHFPASNGMSVTHQVAITLGGPPGDREGSADEQAAMFMHEFGHYMGLQHGGGRRINYKPNYLSVMNYAYTFDDVWPRRPLDYSRTKLRTLKEWELYESRGMRGAPGAPGAVPRNNYTIQYRAVNESFVTIRVLNSSGAPRPIDWNGNGRIDEDPVYGDINFVAPAFGWWNGTSSNSGRQLPSPGQRLRGYDDWANIDYTPPKSPLSLGATRPVNRTVNASNVTRELNDSEIRDMAQAVDSDGDGLSNWVDLCPMTKGANQTDTDGDGHGDACDPGDIDLAVSASAPSSVPKNGSLDYTLSAVNNGTTRATDVVLAATVPTTTRVSSTSALDGCDRFGNTLFCRVGTLSPGERAVATVSVAPTTNGTVETVVEAISAETDTNDSDNVVRLKTTVTDAGNLPPDAGFRIRPAAAAVGESITLDASVSRDADGSVDSYAWDLDGDGETDATGTRVTRSFDTPGSHPVTLRVTDDGGATGVALRTVLVSLSDNATAPNQPPAVDAGPDAAIKEGEAFTRTVTITDPDSSTWSGSVAYGDGTGRVALSIDGPSVELNHTYADDGEYRVNVTVDDGEATGSDTLNVSVANVAPTLAVSTDGPVEPGAPLTLSATVTDPGRDTHTATIDWDDGNTTTLRIDGDDDGETTATGTAQHVFATTGTYNVSVTVTDGDGGSDTAATTVTVENLPPSVTATGGDIFEGEQATVTAEFTDAGTGDTHTATVDWGDGTTDQVTIDPTPDGGAIAATHEYGDDGDYQVTVTVTDDEGAMGTATATVAVTNRAPSVSIDRNGTVVLAEADAFLATAGTNRSYTTTASDPGSDDLTVAWRPGPTTTYYNDGSGPDPDKSPNGTYPFARTDTASVSFGTPDVHEVAVTVTDDDGASATDTATVVVVGDDTGVRGVSYWRAQYNGSGTAYAAATLRGFANVTDVGSAAFDASAATPNGTAPVLDPGGSARAAARAEALAAWLNFASGRVGWTETVDTDDDGTGDRAFRDVIGEVDSILNNDSATDADLQRAEDLAAAINGRDASDRTDDGGAGETDDEGPLISPGQPGFGTGVAVLVVLLVVIATRFQPAE